MYYQICCLLWQAKGENRITTKKTKTKNTHLFYLSNGCAALIYIYIYLYIFIQQLVSKSRNKHTEKKIN